MLDAELLGCDLDARPWYRLIHRVELGLRLDIVQSAIAARKLSRWSVLVSTSEKAAIPLAALSLIHRKSVPHVVIAHRLSSRAKDGLFRIWPLQKRFSALICVSRAQAKYAIKHLGISAPKVHFVYDKVDHHFFQPLKQRDPGDYVLAVGKERRDYQTLVWALSKTGIKLIVVVSSPWSTSTVQFPASANVTVMSQIPYGELRDLYAGARLVVIPLLDVDYAAGANAVLEAMAMGKALIVSRTQGLTDYVHDGETGVHVSPKGVEEMQDAILSLWHDRARRQRLGANARLEVESSMNLDRYVQHVVGIVRGTLCGS
jgi:glycosyltransferase involved in cell wall biosynthesis